MSTAPEETQEIKYPDYNSTSVRFSFSHENFIICAGNNRIYISDAAAHRTHRCFVVLLAGKFLNQKDIQQFILTHHLTGIRSIR